jgi:hypothetical protein
MNGAPLPDELVPELAEALRARPQVSRAFLVERAGDRPTLTFELDGAPEELAAYRGFLHELFGEVAAVLGEHAHALSLGAGPPEAVGAQARESRIVYQRDEYA